MLHSRFLIMLATSKAFDAFALRQIHMLFTAFSEQTLTVRARTDWVCTSCIFEIVPPTSLPLNAELADVCRLTEATREGLLGAGPAASCILQAEG